MFFVPYFAMTYADHPTGASGDSYTVFELGTVCFSAIVVVINLRVAMAMHFHHWFFQLAVAGSALLWVAAAFIFDAFNANGIRGGVQRVFGSAIFWVRVLGSFLALLTSRTR
jgi:Phospholipid-translocating P-type ATPase C-terminal